MATTQGEGDTHSKRRGRKKRNVRFLRGDAIDRNNNRERGGGGRERERV